MGQSEQVENRSIRTEIKVQLYRHLMSRKEELRHTNREERKRTTNI
jgi:hypothetical protein